MPKQYVTCSYNILGTFTAVMLHWSNEHSYVTYSLIHQKIGSILYQNLDAQQFFDQITRYAFCSQKSPLSV